MSQPTLSNEEFIALLKEKYIESMKQAAILREQIAKLKKKSSD